MISTKKHVQQLAFLLYAKGINDIVISPGSRNGPIIHTLALSNHFNCRSIVDERSAAYFAIGLSQASKKPVAVVCSSGTAALNFAPAVAEAFYLNIPLVIITADRPDYWINQGENQTINQQNIYHNYCKKGISLPLGESEEELWYAARLLNEIINLSTTGLPGPVHINVPLEEPLHDLLDEPLPPVKVIHALSGRLTFPVPNTNELIETFNRYNKIIILPGQMPPDPLLEEVLVKLSLKTGAVVLKEHLSNLTHSSFAENIDLLVTSLLSENTGEFSPDLLITFGGTFVSKSLKQFLRTNKPAEHWHLCISEQYYDTYQSLTHIIHTTAIEFLQQLSVKALQKENDYAKRWINKELHVKRVRDEFINQSEFSDLSVFNKICKAIPKNSVVHLGNSSPVRYALLCDPAEETEYYSNRGTSGIDGSLSTAVGFASVSQKLNTVILGDLSFFYDSNALWNNYIGKNLRIIVIHNGGGNIFSMIKGPAESQAFDQFFYTKNSTSAKGIASTFGLEYLQAKNERELQQALSAFYTINHNRAVLLEIFTNAEINAQKFRALFKTIKEI